MELCLEPFLELVQLHGRIDYIASIWLDLTFFRFGVVLILNLPYDFLQNIFQSDQSSHTAVFVNNHS